MIGIYKVTNNINGKVYIGQSINIEKRWKNHINHSFNNSYSDYNSVFHKAIRKYGIDNFNFEIIEECKKEELNKQEKYWIKYYNSYLGFENCNGYNMTLGGETSNAHILTYKEVEEIQHLLMSTRISQTDIGNQYNISQVSVSEINRGLIWVNEDLSYPLRTKKVKITYCIDCGKELKDNKSIRCIECYKKASQSKIKPPKEELEKILFENNGNFEGVGRLFGINGNAIRKWCKSFDLPYHSSDYKKKIELSDENKIPTQPKKIAMLDKNTEEVLQIFDSINEAGKYINTNGTSHISDAAKGRRNTAYGYKWKFL